MKARPNKPGNSEIRSDLVWIAQAVAQSLHRDKTEAQKLVSKIEETQKLRKELNSVKKLARERSKAVSIRVPQLKDCKNHYDHIKENTLILKFLSLKDSQQPDLL